MKLLNNLNLNKSTKGKQSKKAMSFFSAGFTLVETLVSLFIFAISITAIIVVSGKGISDTTIAKNKIIATALAQEGIEMMRAIRDTQVLTETVPGDGWIAFVDLVTPLGEDCRNDGCYIENLTEFYKDSEISDLDPEPDIRECPPSGPGNGFPSNCPFLNRERLSTEISNTTVGTIGVYGYDSSVASVNESQFQRTIKVDCIQNPGCTEMKIESIVAWQQGTKVMQVVSSEHLFNWFKITPVPTTP